MYLFYSESLLFLDEFQGSLISEVRSHEDEHSFGRSPSSSGARRKTLLCSHVGLLPMSGVTRVVRSFVTLLMGPSLSHGSRGPWTQKDPSIFTDGVSTGEDEP